jgi:hypothetical protein
MIEGLNDNHSSIEPTDELWTTEKLNIENEDIEELNSYGDFQVAGLIADYYLKENLTKILGSSIETKWKITTYSN